MNGTLTSLNQLLLSDRLFEIPIYQRGYAWEEENVRDLWDDLYYLGGREHYFGTILLKEADPPTTRDGLKTFQRFEVIDGQQRLTTTLILLRELISQMKELGDDDISDQVSKLEADYIVYRSQYKLTIGGEDASFLRDSILAGTSAAVPQTRAQERLRNAKTFFRDQFERHREQGRRRYLDFLIDFKSRIDRLQVMLYIVPSTAEAVRMFETVNDRGRPLTDLEKTKSILMYASYLVVDGHILETRLSELNDHFSGIYRCFKGIEEGFPLRDAGEIQRYHHITFSGPRDPHRHMRLLKDLLVRMSREEREDCRDYIRKYTGSLRNAFDTMRDIAERRREQDSLGSMIYRLVVVESIANLYPLLVAVWQRFREDSQRQEILRLFEAFVFRVYRVAGKRSHTGRSWLNSWAFKVHNDGNLTVAAFLQWLRELNLYYLNDDGFRDHLSAPRCYTDLGPKMIKYLLAEYEMKLRTDAGEPLSLNLAQILSSEYETEHILPQHPSGLGEDEAAAHQEIVHRLGNLTLASREWNRKMSNRSFDEKKTYYRESSLRVQRDLAKWQEWNETSIRERGERIIAFALERWQIDPPARPQEKSPQISG